MKDMKGGDKVGSYMGSQERKREKKTLSHWGDFMKKMNLHSIWLWKQERLNFMTSYNQRDLKPGTLEIAGFALG